MNTRERAIERILNLSEKQLNLLIKILNSSDDEIDELINTYKQPNIIQ